MSFDPSVMDNPASKKELASVTISVALALTRIEQALSALNVENDNLAVRQGVAEVSRISKALQKDFEAMTGWTEDDR